MDDYKLSIKLLSWGNYLKVLGHGPMKNSRRFISGNIHVELKIHKTAYTKSRFFYLGSTNIVHVCTFTYN